MSDPRAIFWLGDLYLRVVGYWAGTLQGLSGHIQLGRNAARSTVPTILRATLLPFKDVIITDGLVSVYPIMFGPNSRSEFKETYMDVREMERLKL